MQSDKDVKITPEMEKEIKAAWEEFGADLTKLEEKWEPRLKQKETYLPGILTVCLVTNLVKDHHASILGKVDKAVLKTAQAGVMKHIMVQVMQRSLTGDNSDSDSE